MSVDVFDTYVLHSTPEAYALESGDGQQCLLIDRVSGDVKLTHSPDSLRGPKQTKHVFGAAGVIQLLDGAHLIVITSRTKVNDLKPIYRIDGWQLLPLARSDAHLTEEQKINNSHYKQIVMQVLNTPSFYYSTKVDLTHTLQRLHRTSSAFKQMSLFKRADSRFVWNQHLLADWETDPRFHRFLIPIMHGFIASTRVILSSGRSFYWTIISRRSVHRAGTRFNMRGADTDGNVANFVETEMMIETTNAKSSFVQTRGSLPVLWQQVPDLRYKPPPTVLRGNQEEVVRKHLEQQIVTYGKQVIINLIDQKGAENTLGLELKRWLIAIGNPQVRYEPFDFHNECKGMRYDKLQILVDRVASAQDAFGFFLEEDGVAKSLQQGVFRTNCIDCLDRTNVVQSLLAKRSMQAQLVAHGVINTTSQLDGDVAFENLIRNIWADNGDACSIQYAGTGALKADFTRTGKRTVVGALWDGWNSSIRYYKNNFADGQRQDGIDLVLGNCRVNLNDSPIIRLPPDVFLAPLVLVVLLVLMVLLFFVGSRDKSLMMILIVCSASIAFLLFKIKQNRKQYIDTPRLKRHGSFRN